MPWIKILMYACLRLAIVKSKTQDWTSRTSWTLSSKSKKAFRCISMQKTCNLKLSWDNAVTKIDLLTQITTKEITLLIMDISMKILIKFTSWLLFGPEGTQQKKSTRPRNRIPSRKARRSSWESSHTSLRMTKSQDLNQQLSRIAVVKAWVLIIKVLGRLIGIKM
jgi:hypothetical protein